MLVYQRVSHLTTVPRLLQRPGLRCPVHPRRLPRHPIPATQQWRTAGLEWEHLEAWGWVAWVGTLGVDEAGRCGGSVVFFGVFFVSQLFDGFIGANWEKLALLTSQKTIHLSHLSRVRFPAILLRFFSTILSGPGR
jgi:hypothetical protein